MGETGHVPLTYIAIVRRHVRARSKRGRNPTKKMSPARDGTTSMWGSPLVDGGIWLIALIATGLTVWYSLGPRPPAHGSDWEWHALAYFIDTLAILLAVVWRPGREVRPFDALALPVALAVLLVGGLIEICRVVRRPRCAVPRLDCGCRGRRARRAPIHGTRWAIRKKCAQHLE